MTIEASTTTNEAAATPPQASTDAAAMAAARAAMGGAEPPAADAQTSVAAAPSPEAAAPPSAEMTELQKIRAEIKAKEAEQKQRERLTSEFQTKFEQQVAAEKTRLLAEARAEARAEFHRSIKENPVDALTGVGVDGVSLVKDIAQRATPQGEMAAQIAAMKAELAELRSGGGDKSIRAELDALKAEREAITKANQRAAVEASHNQLVSLVSAKAAGALEFYGNQEALIARAQAIADEYCAAKQVRVCPYDVVVQELAVEAKRGAAESMKALEARLDALRKLSQQPAGVTESQPTETKGRNQPRTLAAQGAGERRATPKPLSEMTPAEIDEEARRVAREAMGPRKTARMA